MHRKVLHLIRSQRREEQADRERAKSQAKSQLRNTDTFSSIGSSKQGEKKMKYSSNRRSIMSPREEVIPLPTEAFYFIAELRLAGCGLGDRSVALLASLLSLGALPQLQVLDLSHNENIGDDSVEYLQFALEYNTRKAIRKESKERKNGTTSIFHQIIQSPESERKKLDLGVVRAEVGKESLSKDPKPSTASDGQVESWKTRTRERWTHFQRERREKKLRKAKQREKILNEGTMTIVGKSETCSELFDTANSVTGSSTKKNLVENQDNRATTRKPEPAPGRNLPFPQNTGLGLLKKLRQVSPRSTSQLRLPLKAIEEWQSKRKRLLGQFHPGYVFSPTPSRSAPPVYDCQESLSNLPNLSNLPSLGEQSGIAVVPTRSVSSPTYSPKSSTRKRYSPSISPRETDSKIKSKIYRKPKSPPSSTSSGKRLALIRGSPVPSVATRLSVSLSPGKSMGYIDSPLPPSSQTLRYEQRLGLWARLKKTRQKDSPRVKIFETEEKEVATHIHGCEAGHEEEEEAEKDQEKTSKYTHDVHAKTADKKTESRKISKSSGGRKGGISYNATSALHIDLEVDDTSLEDPIGKLIGQVMPLVDTISARDAISERIAQEEALERQKKELETVIPLLRTIHTSLDLTEEEHTNGDQKWSAKDPLHSNCMLTSLSLNGCSLSLKGGAALLRLTVKAWWLVHVEASMGTDNALVASSERQVNAKENESFPPVAQLPATSTLSAYTDQSVESEAISHQALRPTVLDGVKLEREHESRSYNSLFHPHEADYFKGEHRKDILLQEVVDTASEQIPSRKRSGSDRENSTGSGEEILLKDLLADSSEEDANETRHRNSKRGEYTSESNSPTSSLRWSDFEGKERQAGEEDSYQWRLAHEEEKILKRKEVEKVLHLAENIAAKRYRLLRYNFQDQEKHETTLSSIGFARNTLVMSPMIRKLSQDVLRYLVTHPLLEGEADNAESANSPAKWLASARTSDEITTPGESLNRHPTVDFAVSPKQSPHFDSSSNFDTSSACPVFFAGWRGNEIYFPFPNRLWTPFLEQLSRSSSAMTAQRLALQREIGNQSDKQGATIISDEFINWSGELLFKARCVENFFESMLNDCLDLYFYAFARQYTGLAETDKVNSVLFTSEFAFLSDDVDEREYCSKRREECPVDDWDSAAHVYRLLVSTKQPSGEKCPKEHGRKCQLSPTSPLSIQAGLGDTNSSLRKSAKTEDNASGPLEVYQALQSLNYLVMRLHNKLELLLGDFWTVPSEAEERVAVAGRTIYLAYNTLFSAILVTFPEALECLCADPVSDARAEGTTDMISISSITKPRDSVFSEFYLCCLILSMQLQQDKSPLSLSSETVVDGKRGSEKLSSISSSLFVLANGLSFASFQDHLKREFSKSTASSHKLDPVEQSKNILVPLSLVISRLFHSVVSTVSEQYRSLEKTLLQSYGVTKTAPQITSTRRPTTTPSKLEKERDISREILESREDSTRSGENRSLNTPSTPPIRGTVHETVHETVHRTAHETYHTYMVLSNLVSVQPSGNNAEAQVTSPSAPITLLCSEITSIQQGLSLVKKLVKYNLPCLGELHNILTALHTNLTNRLITRLVDLDGMELSCALSLKGWAQVYSKAAAIGLDRKIEYPSPSVCFECKDEEKEVGQKRVWFCPSSHFEGSKKQCLRQDAWALELYSNVYRSIQGPEREVWEISQRVGTLGEKVIASWRGKQARRAAVGKIIRENGRELQERNGISANELGGALPQQSWVLIDQILFQKIQVLIAKNVQDWGASWLSQASSGNEELKQLGPREDESFTRQVPTFTSIRDYVLMLSQMEYSLTKNPSLNKDELLVLHMTISSGISLLSSVFQAFFSQSLSASSWSLDQRITNGSKFSLLDAVTKMRKGTKDEIVEKDGSVIHKRKQSEESYVAKTATLRPHATQELDNFSSLSPHLGFEVEILRLLEDKAKKDTRRRQDCASQLGSGLTFLSNAWMVSCCAEQGDGSLPGFQKRPQVRDSELRIATTTSGGNLLWSAKDERHAASSFLFLAKSVAWVALGLDSTESASSIPQEDSRQDNNPNLRKTSNDVLASPSTSARDVFSLDDVRRVMNTPCLETFPTFSYPRFLCPSEIIGLSAIAAIYSSMPTTRDTRRGSSSRKTLFRPRELEEERKDAKEEDAEDSDASLGLREFLHDFEARDSDKEEKEACQPTSEVSGNEIERKETANTLKTSKVDNVTHLFNALKALCIPSLASSEKTLQFLHSVFESMVVEWAHKTPTNDLVSEMAEFDFTAFRLENEKKPMNIPLQLIFTALDGWNSSESFDLEHSLPLLGLTHKSNSVEPKDCLKNLPSSAFYSIQLPLLSELNRQWLAPLFANLLHNYPSLSSVPSRKLGERKERIRQAVLSAPCLSTGIFPSSALSSSTPSLSSKAKHLLSRIGSVSDVFSMTPPENSLNAMYFALEAAAEFSASNFPSLPAYLQKVFQGNHRVIVGDSLDIRVNADFDEEAEYSSACGLSVLTTLNNILLREDIRALALAFSTQLARGGVLGTKKVDRTPPWHSTEAIFDTSTAARGILNICLKPAKTDSSTSPTGKHEDTKSEIEIGVAQSSSSVPPQTPKPLSCHSLSPSRYSSTSYSSSFEDSFPSPSFSSPTSSFSGDIQERSYDEETVRIPSVQYLSNSRLGSPGGSASVDSDSDLLDALPRPSDIFANTTLFLSKTNDATEEDETGKAEEIMLTSIDSNLHSSCPSTSRPEQGLGPSCSFGSEDSVIEDDSTAFTRASHAHYSQFDSESEHQNPAVVQEKSPIRNSLRTLPVSRSHSLPTSSEVKQVYLVPVHLVSLICRCASAHIQFLLSQHIMFWIPCLTAELKGIYTAKWGATASSSFFKANNDLRGAEKEETNTLERKGKKDLLLGSSPCLRSSLARRVVELLDVFQRRLENTVAAEGVQTLARLCWASTIASVYVYALLDVFSLFSDAWQKHASVRLRTDYAIYVEYFTDLNQGICEPEILSYLSILRALAELFTFPLEEKAPTASTSADPTVDFDTFVNESSEKNSSEASRSLSWLSKSKSKQSCISDNSRDSGHERYLRNSSVLSNDSHSGDVERQDDLYNCDWSFSATLQENRESDEPASTPLVSPDYFGGFEFQEVGGSTVGLPQTRVLETEDLGIKLSRRVVKCSPGHNRGLNLPQTSTLSYSPPSTLWRTFSDSSQESRSPSKRRREVEVTETSLDTFIDDAIGRQSYGQTNNKYIENSKRSKRMFEQERKSGNGDVTIRIEVDDLATASTETLTCSGSGVRSTHSTSNVQCENYFSAGEKDGYPGSKKVSDPRDTVVFGATLDIHYYENLDLLSSSSGLSSPKDTRKTSKQLEQKRKKTNFRREKNLSSFRNSTPPQRVATAEKPAILSKFLKILQPKPDSSRIEVLSMPEDSTSNQGSPKNFFHVFTSPAKIPFGASDGMTEREINEHRANFICAQILKVLRRYESMPLTIYANIVDIVEMVLKCRKNISRSLRLLVIQKLEQVLANG